MKNTFTIILLLCTAFANGQDTCIIKICGSYYYKNKHILTVQGQNILDINAVKGSHWFVDFTVYNQTGKLLAKIKDGVLTEGGYESISIKATETIYEVKLNGTNVNLIKLNRVNDNNLCQILAWFNLYTNQGDLIQVSPDDSNIAMLKNMKGAIFKNNINAISID